MSRVRRASVQDVLECFAQEVSDDLSDSSSEVEMLVAVPAEMAIFDSSVDSSSSQSSRSSAMEEERSSSSQELFAQMEEIEFETDSEFNTYGIGMTESSSDAETESLGRSVLEFRHLSGLSPRILLIGGSRASENGGTVMGDEDLLSSGDMTEVDADSEQWDEEDGGARRSTCVVCGRDVVGPRFHHCRKCWTKFKDYYETRQAKKKAKKDRSSSSRKRRLPSQSEETNPKRRRKDTLESSGFSLPSTSFSNSSSTSSTSSTSSISSRDDGCMVCGEAAAEMSLVHSRIAHQCVCRPCGKRLMKGPKSGRKCPFCGDSFCSVIKVF